jgi:hypothetical protein
MVLALGDAQPPCMLWLDDHPGEGHGAPEGEDWVVRTTVEEALSFLDQCVFEHRRVVAVWVPCAQPPDIRGPGMAGLAYLPGSTMPYDLWPGDYQYRPLSDWLDSNGRRGWAATLSTYHWGVPRCTWHGKVER